jgi:hypothetical protein
LILNIYIGLTSGVTLRDPNAGELSIEEEKLSGFGPD